MASHGPAACAVAFGRLASIGPSSPQQAAADTVARAFNNFQPAGWLPSRMIAWASGVSGLPLTEGVELARRDLEALMRMASHGPIACIMTF